jgi:hypothetical protein
MAIGKINGQSVQNWAKWSGVDMSSLSKWNGIDLDLTPPPSEYSLDTVTLDTSASTAITTWTTVTTTPMFKVAHVGGDKVLIAYANERGSAQNIQWQIVDLSRNNTLGNGTITNAYTGNATNSAQRYGFDVCGTDVEGQGAIFYTDDASNDAVIRIVSPTVNVASTLTTTPSGQAPTHHKIHFGGVYSGSMYFGVSMNAGNSNSVHVGGIKISSSTNAHEWSAFLEAAITSYSGYKQSGFIDKFWGANSSYNGGVAPTTLKYMVEYTAGSYSNTTVRGQVFTITPGASPALADLTGNVNIETSARPASGNNQIGMTPYPGTKVTYMIGVNEMEAFSLSGSTLTKLGTDANYGAHPFEMTDGYDSDISRITILGRSSEGTGRSIKDIPFDETTGIGAEGTETQIEGSNVNPSVLFVNGTTLYIVGGLTNQLPYFNSTPITINTNP